MPWAIWIALLAGVFYVAYRLARATTLRDTGRSAPMRPAPTRHVPDGDPGSILPSDSDVRPPPPIDLRARRVEKTVESLERRVLELEARLRKVEGRD